MPLAVIRSKSLFRNLVHLTCQANENEDLALQGDKNKVAAWNMRNCFAGILRTGNGHFNQSERNMHQLFTMFGKPLASLRRLLKEVDGSVFVEYLLLLTLVGIGVIVGLAAVRTALINELVDLATAISSIASP